MRNFNSLAFIIASAALLAACSSPVKLEEPKVVEKSEAPKTDVADPRDVRPVETGSIDPLNDPKGVLAKRSVYFDYDSYVVRDDGKEVVSNHSGYLSKNKGRKVLIQGNTDERGGTEYNLALGQKRAEAVRKAMSSLGVAESQMEAVSLGEEKPKAMGTGEAVWAENRRADIVY
ncbi:peptidoglycan-associated lipoprotein Pal [Massilia sp. CF038]|uniref:peptidoglycan-associated lipoprotein Pal n=1 Tax=Massilia sp. CF038 TaxID=1881045 RepID=UPI0009149A2B|nr:peptidoglycan-associated lipoprotein Pal [Massilia sp. CF038]SHH11632.1 peptidoglycan-associated lipoprotein [Massilia sp. CF038]